LGVAGRVDSIPQSRWLHEQTGEMKTPRKPSSKKEDDRPLVDVRDLESQTTVCAMVLAARAALRVSGIQTCHSDARLGNQLPEAAATMSSINYQLLTNVGYSAFVSDQESLRLLDRADEASLTDAALLPIGAACLATRLAWDMILHRESKFEAILTAS
jgi:hypothetical protein